MKTHIRPIAIMAILSMIVMAAPSISVATAQVQLGSHCKPIQPHSYRMKDVKLRTLSGEEAGKEKATALMSSGLLHECAGTEPYILVYQDTAFQVARRYVQTTPAPDICDSRPQRAGGTTNLGSPGAGLSCQ